MLSIAIATLAFTVAAAPKAFADLIEYALVVVLIAFAATVGDSFDLPSGSGVVITHLQTSIERAQQAHDSDDWTAELGDLSKTAGAAEALIGLSSSQRVQLLEEHIAAGDRTGCAPQGQRCRRITYVPPRWRSAAVRAMRSARDALRRMRGCCSGHVLQR
jgi:hypothetical protein